MPGETLGLPRQAGQRRRCHVVFLLVGAALAARGVLNMALGDGGLVGVLLLKV